MISPGVAVVTGAASGIGRSVCQVLASEPGMRVVGLDLNWPEPYDAALSRIDADVSDPQQVQKAFEQVDEMGLGPVNYLVCAAGIQRRSATIDLDPDLWHQVLSTHLDGSLFPCQEAARRMTQGGSIVLFSSVAEFFGHPERAPYAVAKAGLSALARCLAVEWADRAIRVNAVAPGYVDTPLLSAAVARGDVRFVPESLHALDRLARPEEIARPVRFLLSDDASFITGETLMVDGGYHILKVK